MEKQNSEYIIKGVERRLIKCVSSFAFMVSVTERSAKTIVHSCHLFPRRKIVRKAQIRTEHVLILVTHIQMCVDDAALLRVNLLQS